MNIIYRIYDYLFPVVCTDQDGAEYRSHCLHFIHYTTIGRKPGCRTPEYRDSKVYQCCRCGRDATVPCD